VLSVVKDVLRVAAWLGFAKSPRTPFRKLPEPQFQLVLSGAKIAEKGRIRAKELEIVRQFEFELASDHTELDRYRFAHGTDREQTRWSRRVDMAQSAGIAQRPQ